jgi:hypothetical protein
MLLAVRIPLISDHDRFVARLFRVQVNFKGAVPRRLVLTMCRMLLAGAAFGAFAVTGSLQHVGVLPQTPVGDASKAMIKTALNMTSKPAFARSASNELSELPATTRPTAGLLSH